MIARISKLIAKITYRPTQQLVNTFIVGTQKGGTTSLHGFLEQLNNVKSGSKKEIGFFSHQSLFDKGYRFYQSYFKTHFRSPYKKTDLLLDATPEYLYYPKVAQRIYDYNPKAKIIIVLREPVSRAYSHWNMFKNFIDNNKIQWLVEKQFNLKTEEFTRVMRPLIEEKKWPAFSGLIDLELGLTDNDLEPSCIRRGIYLPQVKRYMDIFGRENVLILGSKDLKSNKVSTLQKTFDFLNITADPSSLMLEDKHTREYANHINEEDQTRLMNFYEPHNKELFNYLGYEINW